MGQINVNPGTPSAPRGDGGAATIFGMGMMMFFTMAAFVVLALAVGWFVVRPMMFSGPSTGSTSTTNITIPAVPAQQQAPAQPPAAQQPAPAAPAAPARP